ncbi:MAG: hypothetical protein Kow0074_25180 [Candidatus Zixiibacteriota bacterium]
MLLSESKESSGGGWQLFMNGIGIYRRAFRAWIVLLLALTPLQSTTVCWAESQTQPEYEFPFMQIGNIRWGVVSPVTFRMYLMEFPKGSGFAYLGSPSPALVAFGCIRGADTLVSGGWQNFYYAQRGDGLSEFLQFEGGVRSSAQVNDEDYDPTAVADEQFHFVMYDTFYAPALQQLDPLELRPHKSIGLRASYTMYAWASEFAEDFIIVDYWFTNISGRPIEKAVIGLQVHPFVRFQGNPVQSDSTIGEGNDEICGFRSTVPGIVRGYLDTMNIAWSADNDGDPYGDASYFLPESPTSVLGVRILRHPPGGRMAFNWWALDPPYPNVVPDINWGPRQRSDRSIYANSFGQPVGDRALYRMYTNGEIDYDVVYSAMDMTRDGWYPPLNDPKRAADVADGIGLGYCLSFGPLPDIAPGDSVPLTVAYVMGEDFHRLKSNFQDNFRADDPSDFVNNLHFDDLIENARWADWVFDNPGIDTDGDGNRGRAYLTNCESGRCDSVFYKGDGVPDWRGPSAPPPPRLELTTRPSGVTIRWNGAVTETHRDPFSQQRDFEGYRLYLGRLDRDDQYSLLASWDTEDYVRMAFNDKTRFWEPISYPATRAEWHARFDAPGFSIDDYRVAEYEQAYVDTVIDTLRDELGEIVGTTPRERRSYWAPEDYNRTNTYWEADRLEENIIQRVGERDTIVDGEPLTYGIYEVTLSRLNAAVPQYISVTAFDYGDYSRGLRAQESSKTTNSEYAEFIYSSDVVMDSGLKVSVFPNPYKLAYKDGRGNWTSYYEEGYEGVGIHEFYEQDRRIHFINLPDTATISIYTLDGDLVRRIYHPDPFLTTYPSSVGWDLVTRNVQAAVSGIYIWKVDSRLGSQTGKLVIIK